MTNDEMIDAILNLFANNDFTLQEALKTVDRVRTELNIQSEYVKVNMDNVITARKHRKIELDYIRKELHKVD